MASDTKARWKAEFEEGNVNTVRELLSIPFLGRPPTLKTINRKAEPEQYSEWSGEVTTLTWPKQISAEPSTSPTRVRPLSIWPNAKAPKKSRSFYQKPDTHLL